jgi:hypothetical protein
MVCGGSIPPVGFSTDMQRRNLLAALAGAAGTVGAVGSGAFTSVSADRNVRIQVASDANALLSMVPSPGSNGEFADIEDGQLTLQLDGSDSTPSGEGVPDNAVTVIEDIFRIRNQGTQEVFVFIEAFGGDNVTFFGGTTTSKNNGNRIYDAPPSGLVPNETPVMEGSSNALRTPVGAPIPVGVEVDTTSSNTPDNFSGTLTVRAKAEPPEDSPFDDSRFDPNPDG